MLCSIGGIDNEVEFELPRLGPVLFGGQDEVFGAHFQSVFFLVGSMRDDICFGTHSDGPHDSEMAKTSAIYHQHMFSVSKQGTCRWDTYSPTMATFLPGPAPSRFKGEYVVRPAQSIGAGNSSFNVIRNLKNKVLVSSHMARESTLRNGAVGILGSIRVNHIGAVVLLVCFAVVASKISTNLSSNTSAVSNLDASNF